jgi:hypothetical protein
MTTPNSEKINHLEDDNKSLRDKLIISQLNRIEEIINLKFSETDKKIDNIINNQNYFEERVQSIEKFNSACPIMTVEKRVEQIEHETDLIRAFARNSAFVKFIIYSMLILFTANSTISFLSQIKSIIK